MQRETNPWYEFFARLSDEVTAAEIFFEMSNGAVFFTALPQKQHIEADGFSRETESSVRFENIVAVYMGTEFPVPNLGWGYVDPELVVRAVKKIAGLSYQRIGGRVHVTRL